MYRIMMPKGRLVETNEIVLVNSDCMSDTEVTSIDDANGIVFKTVSNHYYLVTNLKMTGDFGTKIGSLCANLLVKGYADLSEYEVSGGAEVRNISHIEYEGLRSKENDIYRLESW